MKLGRLAERSTAGVGPQGQIRVDETAARRPRIECSPPAMQ